MNKEYYKKSFLLMSAATFLAGTTGLTQVGAQNSPSSTFNSHISGNQWTNSQVQQKLTDNINEILQIDMIMPLTLIMKV